MLAGYLFYGTMKGPITAEPLVNNDSQSILVTGDTRQTAYLFGCCIQNGALKFLDLLPPVAHILRKQGNAKVTEQNLMFWSQQHIVRLNISMNQVLIVNILQRIGDLL